MKPKMAMCPSCSTPLVSSMAFAGYEFVCLGCGSRFGWLEPHAVEETPALAERCAALQAEWDEHAGGKLLVVGGWREDCAKCLERGEPHDAHATAEEIRRHEEALAWLRVRAGKLATA